MINIAEPKISEENIRSVLNSLRENSVSTYGGEVAEFEELLRNHTTLEAVCVNSGTSALEVSIDCYFNSLSRKTKYIIGFCDYTFIATPNAILNTGNTPFAIPCSPNDFTININYLQSIASHSKKIDLLVMTLPFGNYNENTDKIIQICEQSEIPIIIDAAASIGLDFDAIKNSLGKCVSICLSFNGNKVITSGAGGAILSNNSDIVDRARSLISLNRMSNYEHFAPGQNKKMPALNAALGKSQMLELREKLLTRSEIYQLYKNYTDDFCNLGFHLFPSDQFVLNAHWIYFLRPIVLQMDVNTVREQLKINGYNSPAFWIPVTKQELYKKFIMFDQDACNVDYPDLLQLPMTLENPKSEIERLVEIMKEKI